MADAKRQGQTLPVFFYPKAAHMRVGYFQFDPIFGEALATSTSWRLLDQVDADLIVLPELFASGYQFVSQDEVVRLAEPVPDGPDHAPFGRDREASSDGGCRRPSGAGRRESFNSAVVVGPTGFMGCYRKTHLFFEETFFFTPGDTGFHVWDIGMAKIGVMICFDWYYPEAARTLALQGADIITHPSNLVLPHCPDSMATRCLENRVLCDGNRIGSEARGGKDRADLYREQRSRHSARHILHRAPREAEDLTIVEIDPTEARTKAINSYNDLLRDRRPALYGGT